jgi:tetratricopeptide (TPR) repeat protein
MADALVAAARGEFEHACARWREVSITDSLDFVAWYGVGSCLASDDAVVPDRRSPSGWRFRTSYNEAMLAYQRAYQLLPSVHRALRAGSYQSVRALLHTRSNMLRRGRGVPPDSSRYVAYPEWQGDSLAFLPQPRRPEAIPVPPTRGMAVRHQRMLFHEIALGWVAAYPRSPDAMEALAIALELLGDPAGLDTLRRARALATTDAGRVRTAAAEVWMRLRQSMPDDLEGLRLARALADSLLNRYPPPGAPEPQLLAGLAALGGRAALAVAYMRETAARQGTEVDAPIAGMAPALLMFAALGGPTDSLRRLEKAVADAIARMPPQERRSAKATWLARAASLAFPSYRFATLGELADIDDYLVDAQTAFARGDRAAARRMFAAEGARRRLTPPEDLTLDGVYPEAALLAEMGDTAGAIAWLDPTLNALSAAAPQLFNDPTRAGALVRAMALRAALARAAGDTAAAGRWERATLVLWNTPARAS